MKVLFLILLFLRQENRANPIMRNSIDWEIKK